MARLGDFIREECHPLGATGTRNLRLIGVSNEHGLHPSSRDASDDLTRYQRIDRDWFAYNPMRVNVGSIGFADDDSKIGFTSPDYVAFSCHPGLSPAYLLHFLKSDYGLEAVAKQCSGAVRKRLYFTGLAEIELPIPSIDHQRQLVRKLDEAKSAVRFICDENSDRHELPKLKQTILQEAITGRLTADWRAAHPDAEPASRLLVRIRAEKARLVAAKKLRPEKPLPPIPESEIPFAIPEGWEWCRLANVISGTESGWSPACINEPAAEGKWGVLKTTAVQICEYLPHENKELPASLEPRPEHEVEIGDILMTRAGPANRVGICALVRTTPPKLMISDKIVRFRPVLVKGEYLELFSNTPEFQKLIEASKQGMAQSQVNISQENLKSTVLPLPPLAEQTEIVARVDGLMERCREMEAEIERSRAHAAALLQAVLREAFAPAASAPTAGAPVEPAIPTAQPSLAPAPLAVTTPPRKKLNQHFARAVLSAEIVHQLHAEPTFGRVKHQKIFHLCEHIARIEEIAGQYHREAAGPLDNRLIYANEGELKKQQWYREVPRDNAHGHAYVALAKAGVHEKYLASFAEEQVGVIRRLIDLMRKWNTDRCEIFCTAYAAWNDLLLWRRDPTEDAILHEILERWNPAKRRFPRERWQAALKWMRDHDFAPTGFGKPTAKP